FDALEPITAQPTQASAIRIGNPVSYERAVRALQRTNGVVTSSSEQALTEAARLADETGTYLCPHTAVAVAAVIEQKKAGIIKPGEQVVVVSTAHGLKFTEFKVATVKNQVPGVALETAQTPIEVPNEWQAVRTAALGG
ncbi:MAG: pyridoxal-phosphate dependent enzyme, partial [Myxococcota bacterium]